MKLIPAAPLAAGMIALGAALSAGRGAPTQDFAVAGTARDAAGRPVAGAEVVALLRRVEDAGEPEACAVPGTALGAARGVTDRSGAFRLAIPLIGGDPRPNCLMMFAVIRDTVAPWRQRPPSLAGELVLPLSASAPRADLVLSRPDARADDADSGTQDDEAAELASGRVPGFAGMMIEGCTLVVLSTDPARHGAAARAHARATRDERIGAGRGCPTPQPVEVRRVRYDFAQLSRWYSRIDVLMAMEGAASSDIDEARNRIVLEYTDPVGAARARRSLPALGVPVEAVVIEAPPVRTVMPSDTFGPDTPRVGVRLAPRFWAASPSWSADGREIFFTSADGPRDAGATLQAVDVASRRVRQVGRAPASNSGRSATRVSRDGRWVFAALSAPGSASEVIWRFPVAGGAPERIADRLEWPWFAASADGSRFAFHRAAAQRGRGQLVVLDAARGSHVPVPGTGGHSPPGMMELSPDGARLVYSLAPPVQADSPGVYLFDVAGARTRRVWAGSREIVGGPRAVAVRWAGSTPLVLIAEPERGRTRLSVLDAASGTRTPLGDVATGDRTFESAAWSADGGRVALWTPVEIGPQSCGGGVCISRNVIHWRLLVWNAATRTATTAAELTSDEGASWLAFSPDGRRIGYVLRGQLHVVEVR